jgi:hypothetical protein
MVRQLTADAVSIHAREVPGHEERVRPAVQNGPEQKRQYEGELALGDEVKDGC